MGCGLTFKFQIKCAAFSNFVAAFKFKRLNKAWYFTLVVCWHTIGVTTDPYFQVVKNIRIYHECEGGIEVSFPRITDWHHKACR